MHSLIDRISVRTIRALAIAAGVVGMMAFPIDPAAAVSSSVRNACMSDYFAYCSQHEVGSSALRRCMQAAGPRLSKACVSALVASGEVKQATNHSRSSKSRKRPA